MFELTVDTTLKIQPSTLPMQFNIPLATPSKAQIKFKNSGNFNIGRRILNVQSNLKLKLTMISPVQAHRQRITWTSKCSTELMVSSTALLIVVAR